MDLRTLRHSDGLRQLVARVIAAAFDGGAALAYYTGPMPARPDEPATGTLLAIVRLASDAFAEPVDAAARLNATEPETDAPAGGEPGYVRMYRVGDTSPDERATPADLRLDIPIPEAMELVPAQIERRGMVAIEAWTYEVGP